jgi:crossover junction endodeoxyribonuclease RuvC
MRLRRIRDHIINSISFRAALVVIEQPAFSRQTGHMHDRSGLWWLVVNELHSYEFPVVEVTPGSLKKYATGSGTATKHAVVDATARRFPDIDTAADDNRCDALWLAAMGYDHLGHPIVTVPAAHRAALAKVQWGDVAATTP